MNWGRAKTILIIMFAVIDIFLLCILAVINKDASYINDKAVAETVKVLNSRGITVKEEQIPRKRIDKKFINFENLAYAPEKAAKQFLGDKYELFSNEEGRAEYRKENATVVISNNEIVYTVERETAAAEAYEDVKKALMSDLKKIGYGEKEVLFEGAVMQEGICHFTMFRKYDGLKISGTGMSVEADKNGILKLSGRCFSYTNVEKKGEYLNDVTSSLISMIYNPEFEGLVIDKINVIYYINSEYIDGSGVAAYPAYVVTDSNGKQYIL